MYRSYHNIQNAKDKHQEQKKLNEKKWIYCDVDDTLVVWKDNVLKEGKQSSKKIKFTLYETDYYLYPHKKNIELLKKLKLEGNTIVVWSAGGQPWAKEVADKLQINNYIDFILAKPDFIIDDLKREKVLDHTKNLFINFSRKDLK